MNNPMSESPQGFGPDKQPPERPPEDTVFIIDGFGYVMKNKNHRIMWGELLFWAHPEANLVAICTKEGIDTINVQTGGVDYADVPRKQCRALTMSIPVGLDARNNPKVN